MTHEEFNSRCDRVFLLNEEDECFSIEVEGDAVKIEMLEDGVPTTYIPDMSDRPQALAYLLGERDDFAD